MLKFNSKLQKECFDSKRLNSLAFVSLVFVAGAFEGSFTHYSDDTWLLKNKLCFLSFSNAGNSFTIAFVLLPENVCYFKRVFLDKNVSFNFSLNRFNYNRHIDSAIPRATCSWSYLYFFGNELFLLVEMEKNSGYKIKWGECVYCLSSAILQEFRQLLSHSLYFSEFAFSRKSWSLLNGLFTNAWGWWW